MTDNAKQHETLGPYSIRWNGGVGQGILDADGRTIQDFGRDVLSTGRNMPAFVEGRRMRWLCADKGWQMSKEREVPRTFGVRSSGNVGQEILDADRKIICWTTDPWVAQVICKLLTESEVLLR